MPTPSRVWISPQAHERLHRELDTLRFLFSAGIADGIPTKTPPPSDARGRYGCNRFMTY